MIYMVIYFRRFMGANVGKHILHSKCSYTNGCCSTDRNVAALMLIQQGMIRFIYILQKHISRYFVFYSSSYLNMETAEQEENNK